MKLIKPRWFTSLYTGWLLNSYVLGLQENWPITFAILRINFAFRYHEQIITKIVLDTGALFFGIVSVVM